MMLDEVLYLIILFHKKASEYDQVIPQSHTVNHPTAPRGRATEQKQ